MKAGDLDRRITVQKPSVVDDPVYGPQPGGWVDVFSRLPAQVQDALPSKSEQIEGGLRQTERTARVRIRWLRGITSDMRIVLHNDVDELFQISGPPAEIGRREWLEFVITEFAT